MNEARTLKRTAVFGAAQAATLAEVADDPASAPAIASRWLEAIQSVSPLADVLSGPELPAAEARAWLDQHGIGEACWEPFLHVPEQEGASVIFVDGGRRSELLEGEFGLEDAPARLFLIVVVSAAGRVVSTWMWES